MIISKIITLREIKTKADVIEKRACFAFGEGDEEEVGSEGRWEEEDVEEEKQSEAVLPT